MDIGFILVILIVSGLICGAIGANLASQKGHGPAGFFLGLLFGPIGIVIALLLPDQTLATSNRSVVGPPQTDKQQRNGFDPSASSRTCPDCAEAIKLRARVCRYCGRRFTEEEVETAVEAARAEDELAATAAAVEPLSGVPFEIIRAYEAWHSGRGPEYFKFLETLSQSLKHVPGPLSVARLEAMFPRARGVVNFADFL